MDAVGVDQLRIVVADETPQLAAALAERVRGLGHEPLAVETSPGAVADAVERERPDLVIVAVNDSAEHALELLEVLATAAPCAVVAALDHDDADFIAEAAERGVTAYTSSGGAEALRAAIELARRRCEEVMSLTARVRDLETRLEQRAVIERAKGVLMQQHDIDERHAYDMLRDHARATQRRVRDVAEIVLAARGLFRGRGGDGQAPA